MRKLRRQKCIVVIVIIWAILSCYGYEKIQSREIITLAESPLEFQNHLQLSKSQQLELQQRYKNMNEQCEKEVAQRQKIIEEERIKQQKKLGEEKMEQRRKIEEERKAKELLKDNKEKENNEKKQHREVCIADKIKALNNSGQAIIVTTNSWGSSSAVLETFEKINGQWQKKFNSMNGCIGKRGFTAEKKEGDMKTPVGVYGFDFIFGTGSNPGAKYEYRKTHGNEFWVDDANSPLYNTWQQGASQGRWNSAENLYIPAYKYAAVINYNTAERISGKGSAIFLHIKTGNGTAGCVAISESDILKILQWVDPGKNPLIIMGPKFQIENF